MAKHSQPFFEITTRLYLPLDSDLKQLSQLHGIDFSDLLQRAEVINFNKPRTPQKSGIQRKKAADAATSTAN